MYPDDEDLKKSCLNYMRYYNTMPWISPFVIGAALGIEDEGGISSLDAVNDFKVGLMGPLAGIGDSLFWGVWPLRQAWEWREIHWESSYGRHLPLCSW